MEGTEGSRDLGRPGGEEGQEVLWDWRSKGDEDLGSLHAEGTGGQMWRDVGQGGLGMGSRGRKRLLSPRPGVGEELERCSRWVGEGMGESWTGEWGWEKGPRKQPLGVMWGWEGTGDLSWAELVVLGEESC